LCRDKCRIGISELNKRKIEIARTVFEKFEFVEYESYRQYDVNRKRMRWRSRYKISGEQTFSALEISECCNRKTILFYLIISEEELQ